MRTGKLNARFSQPIPVSRLIASVWIPTDSRLLPTENLKSERARNVWRQINPAVRLPQRVLSRSQAGPRSNRVASTVYFGRQQIAQCSDCYRFQQIVAVSIHTAVRELFGHYATGGAHKTGYILSDNHVLSLFFISLFISAKCSAVSCAFKARNPYARSLMTSYRVFHLPLHRNIPLCGTLWLPRSVTVLCTAVCSITWNSDATNRRTTAPFVWSKCSPQLGAETWIVVSSSSRASRRLSSDLLVAYKPRSQHMNWTELTRLFWKRRMLPSHELKLAKYVT